MFADEKMVVGHGYQMPKRQSEELETRWRIRKEPVMLVQSLVRSIMGEVSQVQHNLPTCF